MKWLTGGGVVAALAVGGATAWGLGWRGEVLLFAFFVSGSLLTRLTGGAGGRRNVRQVLANGVAAVAACLGSWPVAAGALAAATADTWATEIGSWSPHPPRLITTWKPVPPGTDGGVTLLGTAGGVGGAFCIALFAALMFSPRLTVLWAGLTGMLVDSVLGAAVQGRSFVDNDVVNLAATITGAAVALLFS